MNPILSNAQKGDDYAQNIFFVGSILLFAMLLISVPVSAAENEFAGNEWVYDEAQVVLVANGSP